MMDASENDVARATLEHLTSINAVYDERDGSPCADLLVRRPGASVPETTHELLAHLPGWLAATADTELAEALLASGATLVRHAHSMRRSLSDDDVSDIADVMIEPFTPEVLPPRPWLAALPGFLAAYPEDHPDYLAGGEALIEDYLVPYTVGGRLGPLITSASGFALADDVVAGGLLVVDRAGEGPWVCDIWRDPRAEFAGVGRALLRWSCGRLADAGYDRIGLAVTVSNSRALRMYVGMGFTVETTAWTVRLPSDADTTRPR